MNSPELPEWDNYFDEDESNHIKSDQVERPPLTGKKRYVPPGLYDEPWDKVGDAYGKATLTPYYIEAITSDDDGDVNYGSYWLYAATTHQGSVYKASKMAIPFLVDILTPDNDAAGIACHFLARIALGENHFIISPAYFYKTKFYGEVKKYAPQISDYYQRTHSLEALRLLCFIPDMLPHRLKLSYEEALALSNGDAKQAYLRQASTLITQGFIAAEQNYPGKGYPTYLSEIQQHPLRVSAHIDEARQLMRESPSLLVRGSAAICLAFTGVGEDEVLDLLANLGSRELENVVWPWTLDFSAIAKKAWLFAIDTERLIETDLFPTLDYTSRTKEGVETKHYSQSEILTEVIGRIFTPKYDKKKQQLPSLKPQDVTELQRKALHRMLKAAPGLFGYYTIAGMNLPVSIEGARRLLEESDETVCTMIGDLPLWYILERAVIEQNRDKILDALSRVDAWKVLTELYRPWGLSGDRERNTLKISYYKENVTKERETFLQSCLADSLGKNIEQTKAFLDECLKIVRNTNKEQWYYDLKAQKTGICLLALARHGAFDRKYEVLVQPFHTYAEYSEFPAIFVKELLPYTSAEHQEMIAQKFKL